jgi:hypothetical protein
MRGKFPDAFKSHKNKHMGKGEKTPRRHDNTQGLMKKLI